MTQPYLANVWGAMQGDPFAPGAQLAGVGPTSAVPVQSGQPLMPVPPPPNPSGYPSLTNAPAPPSTVAPAGPPGPNMSLPTDNPAAQASMPPPNMSMGPPSPPVGVEPGPPPPRPMGPGPDPNAFPLLSTGAGGMSKATELERRGPTLLRAQGDRNLASEATIGRVGERNADTAQQEYDLALDQEREARTREAAQQQSMLERQEEMAQRQTDFDSSVKQLSKMGQIDQSRWWGSRTTGQKIAGFIELALSGMTRAPSLILKKIDDDVKAQEFAYYAARDTTNAKQTAYSLAMQKYQNADAARAAARAAAIDITQAQIAQMGAQWKGTETANKADIALASLQDEKMMQIQNGIQFIPSQYQGRRWVDPRTGLVYSEAEAKAMMGKLDEHSHEDRKQVAGIGGQLMVEGAKTDAHLAGKADEGAHQISTQLQQAGVPAARAAADAALAAINKSPGGMGESAVRGALPDTLGNKVLSNEANAREQAYWAFKNASMKAMMGNVTAGEMERAEKQLGSATDPESRRRAIVATLATLEEVEKNAKAGASPAAQAEFDRRREAATGDRPAAPPSANKGWK